MRYDFGTRTATLFLDLFKIDSDEYFKNSNKVVMYKDRKLVDTLYLNREYYNDGNSSYYKYFYNVKPENIVKVSALISKSIKIKDTKSFNIYIKNFIYLFKEDFNNFLFNNIEIKGNQMHTFSNDNNENYYLMLVKGGKIINGKRNIKSVHEFGTSQYELNYNYHYDKLNNAIKKETFSYGVDNKGKQRVDHSILETYSKTGKILQKLDIEYKYTGDGNSTTRETEELYTYNSNDNLIEKKLIFGKSPKYYLYKIDYNGNIIKVTKTFNQVNSTAETFEFSLLK
ncbi:MAG: hypothetical protein ABI793_04315 [Flavobacterium sp.]